MRGCRLCEIRLADAAQQSACDQHQNGYTTEDVFGQGVEPGTQRFFAGEVDLLQYELLFTHPEEHHTGHQGNA